LLVLLLRLGKATSEGVTTDLGQAASQIPDPVREFALALVQVGAIVVPVVIVGLLVWQRRWRRLGLVTLGAAVGAIVFVLTDLYLDLPGRLDDAVSTSTWVTSTRFPSLAYVAGAAGATMVGKPWLSRPWRRASDVGIASLVVIVAIAGTAGAIPLALAVSTGFVGGAAILVALGAPNRRPSPATIAQALQDAGIDVSHLTLRRAEGGRAQLYDVEEPGGRRLFVKVYDRDSRDADLLYRGYRTALYRGPNEDWASGSLARDVEHEALMALVARRAGVRCPALEVMTALPDGSLALAFEEISGPTMSALGADDIDDRLLDEMWRQTDTLHQGRLAHKALHPSNVLVHDGEPVVVDFAAAESSASPRLLAIDRAELIASLAAAVGSERAIASATRVLDPTDLASAMPYLQPLALSASTRKQTPKSLLQELRSGIADATATEPPPVERLVRVKARTLVTIAALTGAFYVLLPQLAHVGDSFTALRTANFWWLGVAVVMSAATYVASAIGLAGGVPNHLPLVPTIETQMASSFINRVTPANVGGMALNVRFMQKAGVDPAVAVSGMGLNVLAGGIVHLILLFVFFAWAGKGNAGFKIPTNSKLLVVIAVVLAVVGIAIATRRGRKLVRQHVFGFIKQSAASIASLARSPSKLLLLFGGSAGVTLAYIAALAASVAAYHGGVSFAEVGAVYLGSALLAAAAPTPGGLGALEAALVAGFTGVGMESGVAVAVVLSYRLVTYWLPILPGWISFHVLERKNLI
jgi:undecaprenyl-diphosphatase